MEIGINNLKYLAIQASDNLYTNEDLRKRDLTPMFDEEIAGVYKYNFHSNRINS